MNLQKFYLFSFLFFLLCSSFCFPLLDQLASALHEIKISLKVEEETVKKIEKAKDLDLKEFFKQIKKLPVAPEYISFFRRPYKYPQTKFLTKKMFLDSLEAFSHQRKNQLAAFKWLKNNQPRFKKSEFFVRKLILPADHKVEFHGSWKGDIHSFIQWLNDLKDRGWFKNDSWQLKEKYNIVLLGDYTESFFRGSGHYGVEILFIIMQLYLKNPDKVELIRGREEDVKTERKKLKEELRQKIDYSDVDFEKIEKLFYKNLPAALYLGCKAKGLKGVTDYIMCCHGAFLVGYDQKSLMADGNENIYQWIDKRLLTGTDYLKKQLVELYKEIKVEDPEDKANPILAKYFNRNANGFLRGRFSNSFKEDPTEILSTEKTPVASYIIESPYVVHTMNSSSEKGKFRLNGVVSGYLGILSLLNCKNGEKIIDHKNRKHIRELNRGGSHKQIFPRYGRLWLPIAPKTGGLDPNLEGWFFMKYFDTSATVELNENGFEKWDWTFNRIPVAK